MGVTRYLKLVKEKCITDFFLFVMSEICQLVTLSGVHQSHPITLSLTTCSHLVEFSPRTSPSRFRTAWPASTKAAVAPESKSHEKMPRNQMCCGNCLDDIKDLSWVTERHVSFATAKEIRSSVKWILVQKSSFHRRFFFWLIIPPTRFYITYWFDRRKSSSVPTKKTRCTCTTGILFW